jgi:hypothetical protein
LYGGKDVDSANDMRTAMEGSCDDGVDLCERAVPREWAKRALERLAAPLWITASSMNGAQAEEESFRSKNLS